MNFSVWVLYAVLALDMQSELAISSTELGLIFAAPMLSGALMRIPAGLLADRMSARKLYFWQMLVTAPSLFLLPYAQSMSDYILLGLWIGLSGASFTIGIRYVTDWFNRYEQGTAMGINDERDLEANLQIGPTDHGMVRLFVLCMHSDLPLGERRRCGLGLGQGEAQL